MPEPVEWVHHDGEDVIDTSPRRGRTPRRPVAFGLVVLVAIALVVFGITENNNGSDHPRAATTPTRPLPSRVTPSGPAPLSPTRIALPPPTVRDVGHRLLGVRGGWELFGRGDGVVVRIELARGRVTTTRIPPLLSTGPVSFLATGDAAIVRPLDIVPGYVVPDDERPRRAAGALGQGGPLLPGPRPGELWAQARSRTHVTLVDTSGRPVSPRTTIRTPRNGFPESDRAGYLLFRTRSGFYDARPDGRTLIGRGLGIIAGPTRWLLTTCHGSRCTMTVIARHSGARHALSGGPLGGGISGSVSPDGAYVAELTDGDQVALIDLRSGAGIDLPLAVDAERPVDPASQMVWSPDGRWLFVVHARWVSAVNARTYRVRSLGVRLPPLVQIAIRPG